MSSTTDLLIKGLAKTIAETPGKKAAPYDTQAEVRRIEGNTAWVHIPGGVDETPVQLTTNAKKGDIVQVRVSGGRAWLYGNATSPPTDDTTAKAAHKTAAVANEHAVNAITSAMLAQESADQARNSAEEAKVVTDQIVEYAQTAEKSVTEILEDAETARTNADIAQQSADIAYDSASRAIGQLGIVEDVVGVLSLAAENGVYERTQDSTPLQGKWYFIYDSNTGVYQLAKNPIFEYVLTSDTTIIQNKPYYTRSGSGTEEDPYVYTPVVTPVQADIGTYYDNTNWNYYELTGVDEEIKNYVSSHLVLAGDSLFLQTNDGEGSTRLELNTQNGITLYDQKGNTIAQYGKDTVIGNVDDFHITVTSNYFALVLNPTGNPKVQGWYELDDDEYVLTEDTTVISGKAYYKREPRLSFWRGKQSDPNNEVAYISGNKLYITQSVVLQEMNVGNKVADGGLGQWSWKVHEVDGMNNLYLKWLG